LLGDKSLSEDQVDENWDAIANQEEVEAMKDIYLAMNVKHMDKVDVEQYPRFVIKNFGGSKKGSELNQLLKELLPKAKVVYEEQEEQ
jgi:hypothetical protein